MRQALSISLVQMDIAWEDPDANMARLHSILLQQASSHLVVLPEMWATGFTMNTHQVAALQTERVQQWMAQQAESHSIYLAGSIPVHDHGKFYNRFVLVGPNGEKVQYDKKHLFSYGKENHHYHAGTTPCVFDIEGWKIKAIVCYDLRFPAWCHNTEDYDMLLVVANWPAARIHHWDALLRARAIENQCYVVAVNRVGVDGNGLTYPGHSAVYDMNGHSLLDLKNDETMQSVLLDPSALDQFRSQYPFLLDRDAFTF
jgi:predicted amidohydrolase